MVAQADTWLQQKQQCQSQRRRQSLKVQRVICVQVIQVSKSAKLVSKIDISSLKD